MNMNLFWGFYLLAFAIALLIVWYFYVYKNNKIGDKCIKSTTGEIIRYSAVLYNKVSLPVVQYEVDGKKYEVVGPKFSGCIIFKVSTPISNINSNVKSNLTTREELPNVLKLFVQRNSIASITSDPLFELYPIGSTVSVYYNPTKPKMAYVQRFLKRSKIFNLVLLLSIILFIFGFLLLFGIIDLHM